jgi:hypothetical protein
MARASAPASLDELFEQLRQDLKHEVQANAKGRWISMRQKQQRYLRHMMKYDAALLDLQKPPLESTDRATAQVQVYQSIVEILEEGGTTRSLSLVPEPPPGVSLLGITVGGAIAGPEFPDRPPGDDPERLAEWNREIGEYARRYAEQYEATEPIQRSHGLFENAMPPDSLDRKIFRIPLEQQWMWETRHNALVVEAEKLILKYPVELSLKVATPSPDAHSDISPSATVSPHKSPPTASGRAESIETVVSPEEQRSRRRHAAIDPMLTFLGWSNHRWADATADENHGHAVAYTTIKRYMDGTTKLLRADSERILGETLQKALDAERSRNPRVIAQFVNRLERPLP